MKNAILQTQKLSFSYPDGTEAIRDLSFTVRKGERIVLLGHNGAGKSTLFLLLNAIHKAKTGKLLVNGKEHSYSKKDNRKLRGYLGVVFQEPETQLFAPSVREEIALGPLNLDLPIDEVENRVEECIESLKLKEIIDKAPHQLSYGQKKRVAIASIISMKPEILVLDEPTSGLDAENTKIVSNTFEQLSLQNKTLIVATHDLDFAWQWADRALVLNDGKLVYDGTIKDLFIDLQLLKELKLQQPTALELFLSVGGDPYGDIPKNKEELKKYLVDKMNCLQYATSA